MHKFLGGGSQDFAAILGDQHGVFDANSAEAFDIGAGLDGDRHPGLEQGLILFAQPRRLVNFEAQAVAGGMDECFVQLVFFQNVAGGCVDFPGGGPLANGVDPGQLRLEHGAVHFADLFGEAPRWMTRVMSLA